MTSRRTQLRNAAPDTIDKEHWSTFAACDGMDTDTFYIGTTDDTGWDGTRNADHIRALRAVCGSCPVMLQCRLAALDEFDRHSFRGGMTPPERRRWARKLEKTA